MGEEADLNLYTGCPCDAMDIPVVDDDVPISTRNTPDFSELPEYPDDGMTTLLPCITCNRTFNPAALERHRKVCEKLALKPKNVFDSTKKRLDELDVPRGLRSKDTPTPKAKSRWREKRAEFLRAIRAAKVSPEDDQNGEGHIPSDYIQCEYCSRHFGPKAADRHIQWCKEQKNRLPKYHTEQDVKAENRLKARVKYVPPRPGQSGWKAPKKKDVISSIPPQNMGTSPARLIPSPNINSRHSPPTSPARKASSASLPPNPPRYHTGSLGRSAGKQFSSMLQTVTGCSPGYGVSSGYGSSAMYGAPSGQSTPGYSSNFQRSASLRLPRKRYGQKMARHRDLASDMLASVTMGGKSKRLDPEGDEDTQSLYAMSTYDRPSNKTDKEIIQAKDSYGEQEIELVRHEREALDLEINFLEKQLMDTEIQEYLILEQSDEPHKTLGLQDVSLIDSDFEGEISHQKSSEVSEEDYETRPRSVHFEDERWINGHFVVADDPLKNSTSSSDSLKVSPWFTKRVEVQPKTVREILKQKREERGEHYNDGRRRINEGKNKNRRSNSRDSHQKRMIHTPMRKAKSIGSFTEYQQESCVSKVKAEDAGVISKRDYAQLKSLVGAKVLPSSKSSNWIKKSARRAQDPHYDPFSAAELQFQSLLTSDSGHKHGLYRNRLGSTSSLKNIGLKPDTSYRYSKYKPRSSSLGPDYHNLTLFGFNPLDLRDSGENSPVDLHSPEENLDDILSQFSNYKSPHFSPSSPFHMSPTRSPRISPTRTVISPRISPSRSSPRARSLEPFGDLIASLQVTAGSRKPADGATVFQKSPSPEARRSKESSPLRSFGYNKRDDKSPTLNQNHSSRFTELNGNSPTYGWIDSPSNNFSRHFGRNSMERNPKATTIDAANSTYDSIKILKASLDEDSILQKKFSMLDSTQKRMSSGSSTDSSLPPLSSPSSNSDHCKSVDTLAQLTRFCHECGHKYPVAVAKFCCQCGAKRINVGD